VHEKEESLFFLIKEYEGLKNGHRFNGNPRKSLWRARKVEKRVARRGVSNRKIQKTIESGAQGGVGGAALSAKGRPRGWYGAARITIEESALKNKVLSVSRKTTCLSGADRKKNAATERGVAKSWAKKVDAGQEGGALNVFSCIIQKRRRENPTGKRIGAKSCGTTPTRDFSSKEESTKTKVRGETTRSNEWGGGSTLERCLKNTGKEKKREGDRRLSGLGEKS